MELKAGYKPSEVGIIPEDWDIVRLGAVANFRTGPFGSALHKSDYVYGGIPVINPMQIIDGKIINTPRMAISEEAAQRLSDFQLFENDIVIGRRGEMGRCAVVQLDQSGWLCGTGSMIVRSNARLESRFAQRILSSPPVVAAIEATSVGTTMINLNQGTLSNLKISLPPTYAEQQAIAEALSDTDALIDLLEQLLTKKRQIKQGAMQELLTGQRRLPDFTSEWMPKQFGELLTIRHGKNQRDVESAHGDIPILATSGEIGKSICPLYDKPSVLIGRKGTIDKPQYMDVPFWTVDTLFYSEVHAANSAKFLFYRFCLIDWRQYNEASGVPSLNAKTIESVEIFCPDENEQNSIAFLLDEIGDEITTLETKLQKARHLKQGMMQELLTGRIRLV